MSPVNGRLRRAHHNRDNQYYVIWANAHLLEDKTIREDSFESCWCYVKLLVSVGFESFEITLRLDRAEYGVELQSQSRFEDHITPFLVH